MIIKQSITCQKLGSWDFWQIATSVLNKGKCNYILYSIAWTWSSASDKTKLFAKNFSKNSSLDGLSISSLVFPPTSSLKVQNISATPKMVKLELELSYILTELFNKCLKYSCFPDCCKVSLVVPVFKNVGERSNAKNYYPWLVKSLKKLFSNRIVDHLAK